MENSYVNIKTSEINLLLSKKINETDLKIYLYLCSKMTFAHEIFGVFSHQTIYTLKKLLGFDDKNTVQRSLKKLQDLKMIFVVFNKKCLIISKVEMALSKLKTVIEENFEDFNLNAARLKEIEASTGLKFDLKKIYAKINEKREKLKKPVNSQIKELINEKTFEELADELFADNYKTKPKERPKETGS